MLSSTNSIQEQELLWLLDSLQETLKSLKAGFEECRSLLAPTENGSTLVLSTLRSEAVKGFVTRNGTRITKGVCVSLLLCICKILNLVIEYQTTTLLTASTQRCTKLSTRYFHRTSRPNSRSGPAYRNSNLYQCLSRYRRCKHLEWEPERPTLYCRPTATSRYQYTRSETGVEGW